MKSTTIGTIISRLRYEKGYSKRQLCQGLCSVSLLGFIESDRGDTDQFLLNMLLQRLGKSPDKLEVILSDEEYERIRARDDIEELIWKQEKEQAIALLEKYEKQYARNRKVHRMFVLRSQAYISYHLEDDINQAEYYIREAIELTLPEITSQNMKDYLLAGNEIENILMLCRCLLERNKDMEAEDWLIASRSYVEKNVTDQEEYSKLNGKISWLLSKLLVRREKYEQAFQICEDALNDLRKYGILYFMIPLLQQMMSCGKKMEPDFSESKWRIYYDILMALYHDYGVPWYCHDSLFHNCQQTVYHLTSEFIRQERQTRALTQDELSEGVYMELGNLSRLERGEITPTKKVFEGLLDNLGIERGKYCGTAIVENYELLELKYEIDILIGTGRYEEAQNKLEQLRSCLDEGKRLNRMAVEAYQGMIDVRYSQADAKEIYEKLVELLIESSFLKDNIIHRVPFYNEMLVLNMMCECLRRMDAPQFCVSIYQEIIKKGKESRIDIKYQNNIISLALANIDILDPKREWCEKGIAYELLCGKGNMIYLHLMSKMRLEENEETRRETTRLAYYMADLFYRETNQQRIKTYFEHTYKEPLL